MWPWDHLAFGYLLYLILGAPNPRSQRDDLTFLVLAIGTQLPDLIDKPLAWSLGLLPSGLSLGHSAVFLAILIPIAVSVSNRYGRPELAGALVTGVASHLIGDVLFALLIGSPRPYQFLFWPAIPTAQETSVGFGLAIGEEWSNYIRFLSTSRGALYLFLNLTFNAMALVVWILDGTPGMKAVRRWAAARF
jgi:hypothetical protein